jgi:4-carboxymuconolactone decarboxylase
MARKANAQFAWAVHEQRALKYGIEHTIIEAIKMRCTPKFNSDIELLTYDLVNELNETKTLSSVSYQKAIKHFSVQALVELVSLTGFYVMVAMILNSFEADTPTGEQLLF